MRHTASEWRVDGLRGVAFPCDDGQTLCLLQPPVELDAEFRGRKVTDAYRAGVEALPRLARRLEGAEMVSRVRSCTGIESYFRRSSGPAGHFRATPATSRTRSRRRDFGMPTATAAYSARRWPRSSRPRRPRPHAIDASTAEWGAQRERDCVEIYQWTNVPAAGRPPSLEYEIYHRAQDHPEYTQTRNDIYNRVQTPSSMLPLTALPGLGLGALRQPTASSQDVVTDVRTQLQRLRNDRNERRALVRPVARA